jgi:FkbM family methyltransferase
MSEERVVVRGVPLVIRRDTPDRNVAKWCLELGEFDGVKEFVSTLRYGFIIDAGGYIGTAAIAFARMFPDALIVTIEPSSDNFRVLRQNVAPFANIVPLNKALVGTERTVDLLNRGTGPWGFTVVEQPRDKPDATHLERVEGITTDALLRMFGREGIDIFKLDIEGGEIDVLDRSADWMPRTTLVVAELHERIIRGCKKSFSDSTAGRLNIKMGKEKVASVDRAFVPKDYSPPE